jgi:hypothetical protein
LKVNVAVLLSLTCLLFSPSKDCQSKASSGDLRDGWIISQSSNFAGTVFSEITPDAMRMRIGRLGLTIVTRGPEWNAYIYNENNKNYVEVPKGQFGRKFTLTRRIKTRDKNGELLLTSRSTGRSLKIEGHQASEITINRKADPELGLRSETTTDLWIASDIIAPPEIATVFCQNLNIPVQKGIPLRVLQRKNDKMVSILETLAIKRGHLAPETFQPLKGYKKVKDEIQLLMDDSVEDMLDDSLNSHVPSSR